MCNYETLISTPKTSRSSVFEEENRGYVTMMDETVSEFI
jgi:hypothetical protein